MIPTCGDKFRETPTSRSGVCGVSYSCGYLNGYVPAYTKCKLTLSLLYLYSSGFNSTIQSMAVQAASSAERPPRRVLDHCKCCNQQKVSIATQMTPVTIAALTTTTPVSVVVLCIKKRWWWYGPANITELQQ
jgi:hypothetical protein